MVPNPINREVGDDISPERGKGTPNLPAAPRREVENDKSPPRERERFSEREALSAAAKVLFAFHTRQLPKTLLPIFPLVVSCY